MWGPTVIRVRAPVVLTLHCTTRRHHAHPRGSSLDTTKTLVHAIETSKVDHCNAVLYGLPKYKIERLQYVLNSAARLMTLTHEQT